MIPIEGDPAEPTAARSAVLGCNISPIRKHDPLDYMYSGPPFYTEFERLLSQSVDPLHEGGGERRRTGEESRRPEIPLR